MHEIPQGEPPPPWRAFLRELDAALPHSLELVCFGGFAVSVAYGSGRSTSDIDVLSVRPRTEVDLERLAGLGTPFARRHGLYLQRVGIATPPADYLLRVRPLAREAGWSRLSLSVLDPVDLALTKVERNQDVDRRDVIALAQNGWLDATVFLTRYSVELEPYLLNREDQHRRTAHSFADLIRDATPTVSVRP
jgi:hypothetical protein